MLDPGGTRSRPAPGLSAVPGSARLVVERGAGAIDAALRRVRMSGSAHGTPHGRPRGQGPRVGVVTVLVLSRPEWPARTGEREDICTDGHARRTFVTAFSLVASMPNCAVRQLVPVELGIPRLRRARWEKEEQ